MSAIQTWLSIQKKLGNLAKEKQELELLKSAKDSYEVFAVIIKEKEKIIANIKGKVRITLEQIRNEIANSAQKIIRIVDYAAAPKAKLRPKYVRSCLPRLKSKGPHKSKPNKSKPKEKIFSGFDCICGKIGYPDEYSANVFLEKLKTMRRLGQSFRQECRVYKCDYGLYHLTSKQIF